MGESHTLLLPGAYMPQEQTSLNRPFHAKGVNGDFFSNVAPFATIESGCRRFA